MKITSINNQNGFKGLWGDPIVTNEKKHLDKKMIHSDYETKIYYPFGDEAWEEVNNVMKQNITYRRTITNNGDLLYVSQTGTDVSVKQPLLFGAKQWINYITNKLTLTKQECQLIEQNLKKLHLEKYIRV
jgi:hypothetical protein